MGKALDFAKSGMPPFNSATFIVLLCWTFVFYQVIQVWWIQREPPTYIYEESILDPKNIARGGVMNMQLKIVRARPCTTVVTRYIQDADGTRIDLPATFSQIMKLGYEQYTRQLVVPDYAAQGPARIYVTSTYQCHWSHIIWPVILTRSYDFTISE